MTAAPPLRRAAAVLTLHFGQGETSLRLFTTLATLGAAYDAMLQEIRTRRLRHRAFGSDRAVRQCDLRCLAVRASPFPFAESDPALEGVPKRDGSFTNFVSSFRR